VGLYLVDMRLARHGPPPDHQHITHSHDHHVELHFEAFSDSPFRHAVRIRRASMYTWRGIEYVDGIQGSIQGRAVWVAQDLPIVEQKWPKIS